MLKMKGRMVKNTMCKPLLNYILLLCVHCSYIYCFNSFTRKTCSDTGTFQQMFGISLPTCAEECFRRQRCTVLMFHFGMRYCALKDDIDVQSLGEEGPVCRYYTRDDWSRIDLGLCNGHTCSETERCVSKTDDEFECVKSECPRPDEIADATHLSNAQSIKATNMYTCNNGFFGLGNPAITCGEDAKWSVADFLCINKQSCPTPKQNYINADLTNVEGNLYTPGTIITITCREGYRMTAEEWNITCQAGLLWQPQSISCCPDGSTLQWDTCMTIFNAGAATSYDDAVNYCEGIGSSLTWTNTETCGLFNKDITDLVLQDLTISEIQIDWKYLECAAENGAQGDATQTFKEKITEVRNNKWVGKACWRGNMWSPGQPDLTGDNCVARDVHAISERNYHDVPCNFNSNLRVGFACGTSKILV